MVVPIEVKGHHTSATVDCGDQVAIINQGLPEGLNHSELGNHAPVKGIVPNKIMDGYLVQDVLLSMGGQSIIGISHCTPSHTMSSLAFYLETSGGES